jgi:hypothetical protein
VVLFTDATILGTTNQFYAPDYDAYNDIKLPPFNADVSVIRYPDGNNELANKKAATIASKGGSYIGETEINPDDPQGSDPPRKLHYSEFFVDIPGLQEEILNCDSLVLIMPSICDGSAIEWHSSNGGHIFGDSINVTSISTNGIGTYTVGVKCGGDCVLYSEFNPVVEGAISGMISPEVQSRIIYEDGKIVKPIDREFVITNENDENSIIQDVLIYPNPVNDKLLLLLPEGSFEIIAKDMLGRVLLIAKSEPAKGYLELNVSNLSEGMIILEILNRDNPNKVISKKVTIMH